MTDLELLELIKNEYYRINPTGCWDFFKKRDRQIPCLQVLQKRFSLTFNEILMKAGISDDELNFVRRDAEQYLKKLKEIINQLEHAPSQIELKKMGYTPKILKKYFGSYDEAIKKINCELTCKKSPVRICENKDELLKKYIQFSDKLVKPASYRELEDSNEIYNANIFRIRFGGMKGLKKEAGFQINDNNNNKYTKEEIKEILKKLYIENNGRLKVKELCNNKELPVLATILTYFKTTKISDVWNEIEKELLHD